MIKDFEPAIVAHPTRISTPAAVLSSTWTAAAFAPKYPWTMGD